MATNYVSPRGNPNGLTSPTSPGGATYRSTGQGTRYVAPESLDSQVPPVGYGSPGYGAPGSLTGPPAPTSQTRGGGTTPPTPPANTPTTNTPNPYAPATNYFSPYFVESTGQNVQTPTFGGPVLNRDGSVSTGTPDSWGTFGFNPYSNWSGVNSDTGQAWNVGDRFLNDQGATKLMQLLGLNAPIVTQTGAIRDWASTPGSVYAPSAGTTSGPGGVGMYRYADPLTGQLIDLGAYAPYFISGQDDIGKFLFENRNNPTVNTGLQYINPAQYSNLTELQNALLNTASSPGAAGYFPPLPNTPTTPPPTGTGAGTDTGTGSGDGNSSAGNRSAIDSFIQLLQGIYQGSNPFTIQNFNTTGELGNPGAPFGQDYLDGLQVLNNFSGLGDTLLSLLTPQDLFDVSPTGMYAQFGPSAYLQRALYPEFYV